MNRTPSPTTRLTSLRLRAALQYGMLLITLLLGWRFALFVRHFESFGQAPPVARPPGVEGFLPIGGLVSLKSWLLTGSFDPVHPAALVLLLTILAVTIIVKNAFCSWLCPVGTLGEALWRLRLMITARTLAIPLWPDRLLRGLKYLLLLFFVKLILVDMPAAALGSFLASPYWAVADVRMLHFFTRPSTTALISLGTLVLLSLLVRNAWCRYLCPYGALLGLVSLVSPLKIRRTAASCIDCRRCTDGCPARIRVHAVQTVNSPECTACLTCVSNCPVGETLTIGPPFGLRPLPARWAALLVAATFAGGILIGMLTGHWQSALTGDDYRQLIPLADQIGH